MDGVRMSSSTFMRGFTGISATFFAVYRDFELLALFVGSEEQRVRSEVERHAEGVVAVGGKVVREDDALRACRAACLRRDVGLRKRGRRDG